MTKAEALELIDAHKNSLTNPVEMLQWTWLRVIINMVTDDEWLDCLREAMEIMSQ